MNVITVTPRETEYIPNARFRTSPSWLLEQHKAAFPYHHQAEYIQVQGKGMRPIVESTTISNVKEIRPRESIWKPRATDWVSGFNTSTPKIPDSQVFLRPFNHPEKFFL